MRSAASPLCLIEVSALVVLYFVLGRHLFCVYGDNWINDVKFQIQFLACCPREGEAGNIVRNIQETESKMSRKKTQLQKFQTEYMAAKKAFEEVCMYAFLLKNFLSDSFDLQISI